MASIIMLLLIAFIAFAFWAGVHFFNSYVIAVLLAFAAIMIGRTLQLELLKLWEAAKKKYFPGQPIYVLKKEHFPEDGMIDGVQAEVLGMRVLAMTEELNGKKNKKVYQQMIDETLDALCQEQEIFAVRRKAVEERQVPVEYSWALCGIDGKVMRKCLMTWFKTPNVKLLRQRKQNRDLFIHDGDIDLADGKNIRYTVVVLFDSLLPTA